MSKNDSKWTHRAKWIVSFLIAVLLIVVISYVVLEATKVVDDANDYPEVEVLGNPSRDIEGLSVEEEVAYNLLKLEGYVPTSNDLPDIPIGSDSNEFTRLLNESISKLFNNDRVAIDMDNQMVRYLPSPSVVWISENNNFYPVIFLYIDNDVVTISDTTRGMVKYPIDKFEKVYRDAGSQSVCITERGYVVK